MNTRIIICCFIASLLYGCNSIEEPSFVRVGNVQVIKFNKDLLQAEANMVFDNNNDFDLDLSSADLELLVDDIKVADIDQTYDSSMPAQKEFNLPIKVDMQLRNLYGDNPLTSFGKGLQIVADRKLDVRFKGHIKVGKGSAKVKVPVDKVETVSF